MKNTAQQILTIGKVVMKFLFSPEIQWRKREEQETT